MYQLYSNRIVLPDEVVHGTIVIEEGMISDILIDQMPQGEYLDCTDQYVLPGMINLTTTQYQEELGASDNKFFLEKKMLYLADRAAAESGITTSFNLFALEQLLEKQSIEDAVALLRRLKETVGHTALIDHRVHITFRLGDHLANRNLREIIVANAVDMITCRGYFSKSTFNYQNQYLVQSIQNQYDLTDEEAEIILEKLIRIREEIALDELSFRIKSAKSKQVPFASNRYNLIERLYDRYGIEVDFIVGAHTDETIHKMRDHNVFYGLDVVEMTRSSDFLHLLEHFKQGDIQFALFSSRPQDILSYIFELEGTIGLLDAVKLFTAYPARVANLSDRGSIAIGKRADLVVVDFIDEMPMIVRTIKNGKPIIEYGYSDCK